MGRHFLILIKAAQLLLQYKEVIEQVAQWFCISDVEVDLGSNRKFSNVGIEDIKRSKLSGNLWSFPDLINVIARLVVVKRGFTCFLEFRVFTLSFGFPS